MNLSFIYPIANGSLEEVVTPEEAIERHKISQANSSKPDLEISDEQRLIEFKSCHWAVDTEKTPGLYIDSCTEGQPPVGATHLGPYGYIKKKGNFYYIFKDSGWLALSGKPMGKIYTL